RRRLARSGRAHADPRAVLGRRQPDEGHRRGLRRVRLMRSDQDTVIEAAAIGRLMLFFAIVYAVEGIGQARVGIIFQPLTYYLKVNGWSPLEVTAYFAVLNFPWVIKPVFGLVSDFVPLFGFRRKSYLILSSLGAIVAYAGIAVVTEPSEF